MVFDQLKIRVFLKVFRSHWNSLTIQKIRVFDWEIWIGISDLQSNAKSENVFQRWDICLINLDFHFYLSIGKPKKGFEKLS